MSQQIFDNDVNPELGVEELAKKWAIDNRELLEQSMPITAGVVAYKSGYQKVTQQQGLVSKEALLKLQGFADQMYSDLPIGEVSAFELVKLYNSKYNELTDLIDNLKTLKQ